MHTYKPTWYLLPVLWLGSLFVPGAGATIVQVTEQNADQIFFVASATDLINVGSPALASSSDTGYSPFGGSNTAALNNGTTGTTNELAQGAFDYTDGAWVSTYTLDTSVAVRGYAITNIQTIAAWVSSRQNQSYALSYSTVGAPGTFISLGHFDVPQDSTKQASRITLTGGRGPVADGVKSIRFSVDIGSDANGDVYREFDVFGLADVPEPSTLLLLGAGGWLLWRRSRRQAA